MENRDLTEPDQGLGVFTRSIEVETVSDSVSAFATCGRKDRTNPRIPQGVVNVGEAVFVAAG
jgi:hypothetical protein